MNQGKFNGLFALPTMELVLYQDELRSAANSFAKYGYHETASAILRLLTCFRAFSAADIELARIRDLLVSNAPKTRVSRFGPSDYVFIGRGQSAGQLAQVVLVRVGPLSGSVVYDLRIKGGLVQGTPEEWLCATIEEYATMCPLDEE